MTDLRIRSIPRDQRFRHLFGAEKVRYQTVDLRPLSIGPNRLITGPVPGLKDRGRVAEGLPMAMHAAGMTGVETNVDDPWRDGCGH